MGVVVEQGHTMQPEFWPLEDAGSDCDQQHGADPLHQLYNGHLAECE